MSTPDYGPQTEYIERFIDRLGQLTNEQVRNVFAWNGAGAENDALDMLDAQLKAALDAAWYDTRDALDAARVGPMAARIAALHVVLALVVWRHISPETRADLLGPLESVIGPIDKPIEEHP